MSTASIYAARRAEILSQQRHARQHRHCPGYEAGRYFPLASPRCPHCEPPGSPVQRSQWAAMERAARREQETADRRSATD